MPEPNHSRHAANPHTDATTMFTHSSAPRARREARPCALFLCRIVRPSRAFAPKHLLERHEARRLGGTDTGATVGDGLVGDGELAKVVADHLRLDFNINEVLSVVDGNVPPNKLWENWHVSTMGANGFARRALHTA